MERPRAGYEITAVGGGGLIASEGHPEVERALRDKKVIVYVGGTSGIFDDWGHPVEKNVATIVRYNTDGTEELIYERPKRKKK
jgi:hypothetical protein